MEIEPSELSLKSHVSKLTLRYPIIALSAGEKLCI